MRKLVSTHLLVNHRLQPGMLDALTQAGAEGLELFCARQSFDYTDAAQVQALAEYFQQSPLRLNSLHAPLYFDERGGRSGEPPVNIAALIPQERLRAVEEVQRVLEVADKLPYRYLIQHLGIGRDEWDQKKADAAFTSLERLRVLAKQVGVQILLENIPNGLAEPETLLRFLDQTHLRDIGICFDAGHAQMDTVLHGGGGALETWELLQRRVLSTHLHDNGGREDEHLWPGQGGIEWAQLMPRLAQKGELPWVLEIQPHADEPATYQHLRQSFAQLEAWAAMPVSGPTA